MGMDLPSAEVNSIILMGAQIAIGLPMILVEDIEQTTWETCQTRTETFSSVESMWKFSST